MTAVLIIRAHVDSYDSWRSNFDARGDFRRKNGVTGEEVYCSPEDMTSILVLEFFDTAGAASSFAASPGLAEAMRSSGVIGAPRMTVTAFV